MFLIMDLSDLLVSLSIMAWISATNLGIIFSLERSG